MAKVGYSLRMRVMCNELKVDEDDLKLYGSLRCFILKSYMHYKYYGVWIDGQKQYLHRVIMQPPPGLVVDHINGDTTDNRRINLRMCKNVVNSCNTKKQVNGVTSKYKGVSFYKRDGTWEVNVAGEYFGRYATERRAAEVYNSRAKAIFGEYAKLNTFLEDISND